MRKMFIHVIFRSNGYYETFRGSDFKADHWKNQMNKNRVKEIEGHCWKVLKEEGYHLMEDNES